VIVTDVKAVGGTVRGKLNTMMMDYDRNKEEGRSKHLQIKTGISCLDSAIRGFRKPEFIGVLGYAGNFKTTLCRTFVYNAVMQGFNCLHIPLESLYKEELAMYGILHAHNAKFENMIEDRAGINRRSFEDGEMTSSQERFLQDVTIPDFQDNAMGNLDIRQPGAATWGEIQQTIELSDRKLPLDLVLIDYLALINVGDSRNPIYAMNETIKQVKNLCLTFNGGKGLAVMTPVQGNRSGYEYASSHEGTWLPDGAYLYSEFEKSVDKLLYIYTDDDLKQNGHAKVGSCKSRRTIDAPATVVSRHLHSGRITDLAGNSAREVTAGARREEGWL